MKSLTASPLGEITGQLPTSTGQRMNILIVDDYAANRKLLRVQLETEGFFVAEAADGLQALEVLAARPFDAVISDILMPRMDGYRLCHEVRKDAALRDLRFVLYSNTYTSPADVQLSETVGADQFVAKPAPLAVILGALENSPQGQRPRPSAPADAEIVVKQYSAVLVGKLEEVLRCARLNRFRAQRSGSATVARLPAAAP
jgi:CheY-like chemotaxis protein